MATKAPAGTSQGPGHVPGEVGGGVEVVSDSIKGQPGGANTSPINQSSEQPGLNHIVRSPLPGETVPQTAIIGPQVSVAGHVQHVSVAGQVQQAGPGTEVNVSGGNGGVPPGGDADDLPQKRKATSFKITNVFLSRPPSNDGDDSCDDNEDLEDSHTEDLSDIADSLNSLSSQLESVAALSNPVSGAGGTQGGQPQVIQNATGGKSPRGQPQASSKEGGSLSRKPSNVSEYRRPSLAADKLWEGSLPHYAHPGFGFVTYQHQGGATYPVSYVDKATGYLPVAGTMAVINNVEKGGVSEVPVSQAVAGPQDFRTKFKIVKVETSEPLKRGRWTCFDFVDKPAAKDLKESKDKDPQPEVSKPVTTTTTTTKPATVVKNSEKGTSRPNSTLPKDEVLSDASGPARPESVEPVSQAESDKVIRSERVTGQTETTPVASLVSGSVSEERELDTGKPITLGHSSRLTNSVPPDGLRNVSYPSASYPTPAVTTAVSNGQGASASAQQASSMNITLPQPVAINSGVAVQSPHAGVRPDFPQVQAIQGSLGQVVRLPDGQLAQVALAPLGAVGQQSGSQSQQGQQQQVVLQHIPNSNSHSLAPQQQVVVNAQGQTFLVQPQQQQNISQVPQQAGRNQPAPQQPHNSQQQSQSQQPTQQAKKLSQPPTTGQQQQIPVTTPSQQSSYSSSGQTAASSNIPSAQPMQQQPAGPPVPQQLNSSVASPPQNAQSQVSQSPSTVSATVVSQPSVNLTSQTQPVPQQNQNTSISQPVAQVPTIKRTGLPVTTTSNVQPQCSATIGHTSQQHPSVRSVSMSQPGQTAVSSAASSVLSHTPSSQSASSVAQSTQGPGHTGQVIAHIGQSVAQSTQLTQNSTHPAQSLPPSGINPSKTVPNVAQPGLGLPSLSQSSSSVAQSVALAGMVFATLPSNSLSSAQISTPTTHTTFYPVSYSHPVYTGVTGGVITPAVAQSDTTYGLVATGVGLDGEGLVERLEDLVSTQFNEDGKEGELEHESASGAGQGSIDNRIEQAMDLVKSHLMSAVRSEVEELRDKISKLEDTVTILSRENEILRANVNPEVLASLTGNRNLVGGMNSISNVPPDSSHPALQPPNQH